MVTSYDSIHASYDTIDQSLEDINLPRSGCIFDHNKTFRDIIRIERDRRNGDMRLLSCID